MFLNLPVLANSELPCIWLFGLIVAMGMFSSISSVNFAQSGFISVTTLSLNEQVKEKKNSPQKLKFQHFDLIMVPDSNFRSNFRN